MELGFKKKNTYHNSRGKPDNSRQEGKRLSSLPTAADVAVEEPVPVPDTAAVEFLDRVDQDTKSSEPRKRDNDIDWRSIGLATELLTNQTRQARTWEQREAERAWNQPQQAQ